MKKARFLVSLVGGFVLAAAGAGNVAAQPAPATNGVPVQMVVTVEAHHGSEVPAISASDVMVHEGKDRDRVTDWVPAQGEHAGLEFFILIDDSSSGGRRSPVERYSQIYRRAAEFHADRRCLHAKRHCQGRTESHDRSCGG